MRMDMHHWSSVSVRLNGIVIENDSVGRTNVDYKFTVIDIYLLT